MRALTTTTSDVPHQDSTNDFDDRGGARLPRLRRDPEPAVGVHRPALRARQLHQPRSQRPLLDQGERAVREGRAACTCRSATASRTTTRSCASCPASTCRRPTKASSSGSRRGSWTDAGRDQQRHRRRAAKSTTASRSPTRTEFVQSALARGRERGVQRHRRGRSHRRAGCSARSTLGPVTLLGEVDYFDDDSIGVDGRKLMASLAEADWKVAAGPQPQAHLRMARARRRRRRGRADAHQPAVRMVAYPVHPVARRRAPLRRHSAERHPEPHAGIRAAAWLLLSRPLGDAPDRSYAEQAGAVRAFHRAGIETRILASSPCSPARKVLDVGCGVGIRDAPVRGPARARGAGGRPRSVAAAPARARGHRARRAGAGRCRHGCASATPASISSGAATRSIIWRIRWRRCAPCARRCARTAASCWRKAACCRRCSSPGMRRSTKRCAAPATSTTASVTGSRPEDTAGLRGSRRAQLKRAGFRVGRVRTTQHRTRAAARRGAIARTSRKRCSTAPGASASSPICRPRSGSDLQRNVDPRSADYCLGRADFHHIQTLTVCVGHA